MSFYPPITLSLWNGFLLMIPLLALRFGLPALVRKETLEELEFFPPVHGSERTALKVYFVTNTFLIFSPFLAHLQTGTWLSISGWILYAVGLALMTVALVDFSRCDGFRQKGIYRFSRNPMYVGYFLIFIGTAVLIESWFHLVLAAIYQVAVHWLILSEERWCLENFGEAYRNYLDKVPRYF